MKGRRLPELIVGKLMEVYGDLCSSVLTAIIAEERHALSSEQWSILFGDFERARSLLEAGLQVKLDWTRQLPYTLAAACHHDLVLARAKLTEIIRDFDTLPDDIMRTVPEVALRVLRVGGPLRDSAECFAAGESLANLPALAQEILPFKFMAVAHLNI